MSSVIADFESDSIAETRPDGPAFGWMESRPPCSSRPGPCSGCRMSARDTDLDRQGALLERSLEYTVATHGIELLSQPIEWAKMTMSHALVWYELGVLANCECCLSHATKMLAAAHEVLPWYQTPREWLRSQMQCRRIRHCVEGLRARSAVSGHE